MESDIKSAKVWSHTPAIKACYDMLGEDVMPILGYWSSPSAGKIDGVLYPSLKTDEYFKAVAECGVNLLIQHNDNWDTRKEELTLALDLCEKYGLGYMFSDNSLFYINDDTWDKNGKYDPKGVTRDSSEMYKTQEEMRIKMGEYIKHKGFAGLYVRDEPFGVAHNPALYTIGKILDMLYAIQKSYGREIHPYLNVNLWPDPISYGLFLDSVGTNAKARYFEYDNYIYYKRTGEYRALYGEINVSFYKQLSVVREKAIKYDIPVFSFVSVSAEGSYRLPSLAELSFWVNTTLAYGAKGISYFPISSPHSFDKYLKQGFGTVAMFDYSGGKTETYYHAKEINRQIAAIDHILMNATNHGIIVHGSLPGENFGAKQKLGSEWIKCDSFRELLLVSGTDALIGCFDYRGKTVLYVVNSSLTSDGKVYLSFDGNYAFEIIEGGQSKMSSGENLSLELLSGRATLVRLI